MMSAQGYVPDNSITTPKIVNGAVTVAKLDINPSVMPTPTGYYKGNGTGMVNPGNAIDGNLSTFSGEGSYTGDGGAGNEAGLQFVFNQPVLISKNITVKLGYRASGVNSGAWILEGGFDSIGQTIQQGTVNPGSTEVIETITVPFVGRYFRVKIGGSTTAGIVTYLKVYEVSFS